MKLTEEQKQTVKQALKEAGLSVEDIDLFDDTDVKRLYDGKYQRASAIMAADRRDLVRLRLAPACVGLLVATAHRAQLPATAASSASSEHLVAGKDLESLLVALDTRVNVLQLQMNKDSSESTTLESDIGQEYLKTATSFDFSQSSELACLSSEQLGAVRQACQGFLTSSSVPEGGRSPAPKTLRAVVEGAAGSAPASQDPHLQGCAMSLLLAMTRAVGAQGRLFPLDTHDNGLWPNPNKGLISCSVMATSKDVVWSNLVTFMEFRVDSADLVAAVGQVMMRTDLLFKHQPERSFAYALVLSLDTAWLCRMTKLAGGPAIKLELAQDLPLSVGNPAAMWTGKVDAHCTHDDLAPGLHAIARLLATGPHQLGFRASLVPEKERVGNALLGGFLPLRLGTRMLGPASDVYKAQLGQQEVIVKMGCSPREIDILRLLQGRTSPHCIQLLHVLSSGPWSHTHDGNNFRTAVLAPVCGSLQRSSSLQDIVQVAADVAAAIQYMMSLRILHRDISANNIGIAQGRGVLFDFSASKVMDPEQQHSDAITGTPLFVAYSLLAGSGNVHTGSSQLESLYYSIWHSVAGSLPDERVFNDSSSVMMWAAARRAFMLEQEPLQGVRVDVQPFLSQLHQLFWPSNGPHKYDFRRYKDNVTVQEFVGVCTQFGALPPLGGA